MSTKQELESEIAELKRIAQVSAKDYMSRAEEWERTKKTLTYDRDYYKANAESWREESDRVAASYNTSLAEGRKKYDEDLKKIILTGKAALDEQERNFKIILEETKSVAREEIIKSARDTIGEAFKYLADRMTPQ